MSTKAGGTDDLYLLMNPKNSVYSYITVIVMCPKKVQNANWIQVKIELLIVRGRNLPRTNSTKSETQIIFAKKQQNKHTPAQNLALTYFFKKELMFIIYIY